METGAAADRQPQRRASVRFPLSLPVVFSWRDAVQHVSGGFTLDVSVGGAFILSEQHPPENAEVGLEIVLPDLENLRSQLKLKCKGQVTRVTKRQNVYVGFAVAGCFTDEQLTQLVAE